MTPVVSILLMTLIGSLLIKYILTIDISLIETAAVGWLVGSGLTTLTIFWAEWFGWFSVIYLFLILVLFKQLVKPTTYSISNSSENSHIEKNEFLTIKKWKPKTFSILWILIGLQIIIPLLNVSWFPTQHWDSFHFWHFRARYFLENGSLVLSGAPEEILGGVKNHYPLHMPILKAVLCYFYGEWNDFWALSVDLTGYMSLLIVVYCYMSEKFDYSESVITLYIITSAPFIGIHLSAGYSDLMIAIYLAASVIYWDRWYRKNDRGYLVISAILITCAVWTKNDALVLYMPILMAATFYAGKWDGIKTYIPAVTILILPWVLFKSKMGLIYAPNPGQSAIGFFPEAFILLPYSFFDHACFGVFWFMFFGLIFFKSKTGESTTLWLLTLSIFLAVLSIFVFTPAFIYLKNNMTFQRTLLQIYPLMVIVSMVRIKDTILFNQRIS